MQNKKKSEAHVVTEIKFDSSQAAPANDRYRDRDQVQRFGLSSYLRWLVERGRDMPLGLC